MEMATKTDNRADRRRRIMSREMDRMAVITGRIRNLPPSPPPSPSSPSPFLYHQTHQRGHSHTGISPSFFTRDLHKNPDSVPISRIHAIPNPNDEKTAPPLKYISSNEVPGPEENNAAAVGRPISIKKLDPIGEVSAETMLSPTASTMVQKASFDSKPPLSKTTHPSKPELFTSKRLNASIIASQTTRGLCSLIIASLAVLSHAVRSESAAAASKPLYILLLTNATIVVAKMLAERQKDKGGEAEDQECEKMKEDGQNWDSAVKVLERGLVFYQAFRAIFIDFSVYAVVVICGISLL